VYIAGTVFNDANSNGVRDSSETFLTGWRVYLDLNNDGKFESGETSTLSDSTGAYRFTSLAAGTFRLRIAPPTGVNGYKTTVPSSGLYTFTLGNGGLALNKVFGEHKV
jgi:hypothetical protein